MDIDNLGIREKIRKIYELTMSDVEGERQAAKVKLEELCQKYGLTVDDIVSEKKERYSYRCGKRYRNLLKHIYASVTNSDKISYYQSSTEIGFELTKVQAAEVGSMFTFYKPLLQKELERQAKLAEDAFLCKNALFPKTDTAEPTELSAEEKARMLRILAIMADMESTPYRKQLNG